MSKPIIQVEKLSKQYHLGVIGSTTMRRSVERWWNRVSGNEEKMRELGSRLYSKRQAEDEKDILWALKDVSFDVQEGEVLGIIGKNGAGKSTLLKILSRITEPTSGRAVLRGRVASLLEVGTGFHPELTGRENIYLNGAILGMRKREIQEKFDEIVAFAETEKFIDTPVKHYSSGMYVRLAFAVAAHLEPEILLIDEVLAVGDLSFQKKCLGKMSAVAKEGRTVLFISHNMAAIRSLCDRALFISDGKIEDSGDVEAIIQTYLKHMEFQMAERRVSLPIWNESKDLGITDFHVELVDQNSSHQLLIEMVVEAKSLIKNIGAGIRISSLEGVNISLIAPAMTNFVADTINGKCKFVFTCDRISSYLAGGDYLISAWIAKPRVEKLLSVNDIAKITIPAQDFYHTGVSFEQRQFGFVPLPFQCTIQK